MLSNEIVVHSHKQLKRHGVINAEAICGTYTKKFWATLGEEWSWGNVPKIVASGPARGPPEAPCAAPQCGNGAPALRVAQSTDFPNGYGWLEGRFGEISRSTYR